MKVKYKLFELLPLNESDTRCSLAVVIGIPEQDTRQELETYIEKKKEFLKNGKYVILEHYEIQ